jgi:competence ComEA-like helix-hairpin-helix protein
MTEEEKTLVNVNQGSIEELIALSGIGASLAQRIIDHRPYQSLDDLVEVPGINKVKLASLEPFITLGKPARKASQKVKGEPIQSQKHVAKLGETEAFIFLEDRNERQDALLIIFGGFIFGLILLLLRRASQE